MKNFILFMAMGLLLICCNKDEPEPAAALTDYSVRIFLITPTDRLFNEDYYKVLQSTAITLQSWYKDQMNGKTFTLNATPVETLASLHSSDWYDNYQGTFSGTDPRFYSYHNTEYELGILLPDMNTELYMYSVYVAAGGGGAGRKGLNIIGGTDLDGLLDEQHSSVKRWLGGSGHEWGHGFGLNHPENEDHSAIMWTGYTTFPNCVLLQADRDILNNSPFFK